MTEDKLEEEKADVVSEGKKAYDPGRHLISIQGKKYLPVAQRLVWFREQHPDWGIESNYDKIDMDKQFAICTATVKDEHGRVIAQATKMENVKGFPDWLEKAGTGAVGRALALCGYGTQWADLDEGDRLADAPQSSTQKHGSGQAGTQQQSQGAEKTDKCKCAGKFHQDANRFCPQSPNHQPAKS